MQARLVAFGELEVMGARYTRDVVIDGGRVRPRKKGPSKPLRAAYGHTPLTAAERIPWGGQTLIVGTGADGALPVAPDLLAEARRRGIEVRALPTEAACRLINRLEPGDVHAVLHATC
jgi:hypothetical protein